METTLIAAFLLGEDGFLVPCQPSIGGAPSLSAAQAIESQMGTNDEYKPFGVVDLGDAKPAKKSRPHNNPQNTTKLSPLFVKHQKPLRLSPRRKVAPDPSV